MVDASVERKEGCGRKMLLQIPAKPTGQKRDFMHSDITGTKNCAVTTTQGDEFQYVRIHQQVLSDERKSNR
jgi:hypothetical protein